MTNKYETYQSLLDISPTNDHETMNMIKKEFIENEKKKKSNFELIPRTSKQDYFIFFRNQLDIMDKMFFMERTHWKAHISVHPEDIGKAWDLLYPILHEKAEYFKIVDINSAKKEFDEHQNERAKRMYEGMQITIYMKPEDHFEVRYCTLFQEMEDILTENNIRPGTIHQSDRPLGAYTSIRHPGKNYQEGISVTTYNPDNEEDHFKKLEKESTWNPYITNFLLFSSVMGAAFTAYLLCPKLVTGRFGFFDSAPKVLDNIGKSIGKSYK